MRTQIELVKDNYWVNYLKSYEYASLGQKKSLDNDLLNSHKTALKSNLAEQVQKYAQNKTIRIESIFTGAWALLLHKYLNKKDILFKIDNLKSKACLEPKQCIPIRSIIENTNTIEEYIKRLDAHITEHCEKSNNMSYHQVYKSEGLETIFAIDKTSRKYHLEKHNLLAVIEKGDTYYLKISCNSSLFELGFIQNLSIHFQNILTHITDNTSDVYFKEIAMLSEKEKGQFLIDFNNTKKSFPVYNSLREWFELQVNKTPKRVALIYRDQKISYEQLDKRANRIASFLINKGLKRNQAVAILLENSPEIIIVILGVLKSGGAYLPLNIKESSVRHEKILNDCNCTIILSQDKFIDEYGEKYLIVDVDQIKITNNEPAPKNINNPDDLIYYMYTSGSTGLQKGVMVKNSSVVNLIHDRIAAYQIDQEENILLSSPIFFDASAEQIFIALLSGACLVIPEETDIQTSSSFNRFLTKHMITHLDIIPSFLRKMPLSEDLKLKRLVLGGEAIDKKTAKKYLEKYDVYNVYGLTDATITSIGKKITTDDLKYNDIPIGKPLSNIQCYILDDDMNLMPVGTKGELYLGGLGNTSGYINNLELTNRKFVINPYHPYDQLYKTEDSVSWIETGDIQFEIRKHNQVMLDGSKIDLEKIDNFLREINTVKEGLSVIAKDENGKNHLYAFYMAAKELNHDALTKSFENNFPLFMVPHRFICLELIPLCANGKLDRRALKKNFEMSFEKIEIQ